MFEHEYCLVVCIKWIVRGEDRLTFDLESIEE